MINVTTSGERISRRQYRASYSLTKLARFFFVTSESGFQVLCKENFRSSSPYMSAVNRFPNTHISFPHAATYAQCSAGISLSVLPSSASSSRYIPNARTPISQPIVIGTFSHILFLDGPGFDEASCLNTTLRSVVSIS